MIYFCSDFFFAIFKRSKVKIEENLKANIKYSKIDQLTFNHSMNIPK